MVDTGGDGTSGVAADEPNANSEESAMHDDPTKPTPDAPVEGRPEMDFPGVDRPDIEPDRNEDLPERLGERIERGPQSGGTGEPDLLPDVEVPDSTM